MAGLPLTGPHHGWAGHNGVSLEDERPMTDVLSQDRSDSLIDRSGSERGSIDRSLWFIDWSSAVGDPDDRWSISLTDCHLSGMTGPRV